MSPKKLFWTPYAIFLYILILGVVLLYTYILNPSPAQIGQVIGAETFLNAKGEVVVKYAFIGDKMDIAVSSNVTETAQEKKIKIIAEDLEARTSSSRTFVTNDPNVRISEFISGPQYYEDDLGYWWQAEYAYTTPEQFALLPKSPEYTRLTDTSRFAFVKRALATTDTFYPDANTEVTTVDGQITRNVNGSTFSSLRTGAGTGAGDATNPISLGWIDAAGTSDQWDAIRRSVFGFDTTSIPDANTITSATLSFYGQAKVDNFSQSLVIDRNPPATATALVAGDYDLAGWDSLEQSTARMTITAFSTTGYNDFTLNSTGIGNISKTGVSWFGTRLSGDFDNSEPLWSSNAQGYANANSAEQAGTTQDPKLVVVHSLPTTGSIFKTDVIFKPSVIFK